LATRALASVSAWTLVDTAAIADYPNVAEAVADAAALAVITAPKQSTRRLRQAEGDECGR
jgi:hypothetical protein